MSPQNMGSMKYPIGLQTFSEIIRGGYAYVDKTMYIHRLLEGGQYYFLSRPRRFGKSLFLSTLEAFFLGRKELFEGLAISDWDWDWKPRPVFYFDFVSVDIHSPADLESYLDSLIAKWENEYGANPLETTLGRRFHGVLERAFVTTGMQAAVLFDEYDRILDGTIEEQKLHERFLSILQPIYSVLKGADRYIRFGMITGVSRFANLSIFSGLNNLNDISLTPAYAAICGITADELPALSEGIQELADANSMTYDECLSELRRNYDGYHFTTGSPDIYNPWSLLKALSDQRFGIFWFRTGNIISLINKFKKMGVYLPDILANKTSEQTLSEVAALSDNPVALLFQAGYLTIKSYDPQTRAYTLGLPNLEVAECFYNDLLPVYTRRTAQQGDSAINAMADSLRIGNPDEFLARLKSFLADTPYELTQNKPEIYFENNLFIITKLLGFKVSAEYRTSYGRIDLLISTDRFIYVMELKLKGSAQKALDQIDDKEYMLPFASDDRKLFKIGISFSPRTRNIAAWKISEK